MKKLDECPFKSIKMLSWGHREPEPRKNILQLKLKILIFRYFYLLVLCVIIYFRPPSISSNSPEHLWGNSNYYPKLLKHNSASDYLRCLKRPELFFQCFSDLIPLPDDELVALKWLDYSRRVPHCSNLISAITFRRRSICRDKESVMASIW